MWHGVSHNFSTVAQLLFRLEQRSILCNFVMKMRWTLIGQFLFMRQSCSVRHGMSHLRFCRAIKLQVWHRSKDGSVFRSLYLPNTPTVLRFLHARDLDESTGAKAFHHCHYREHQPVPRSFPLPCTAFQLSVQSQIDRPMRISSI